jgi:two-component system CheB/CheR fusion protein
MSKSRSPHAKTARPSRAAPARAPPRGPNDFPVVGIGASAGGLDACRKLVDALPARSGMAFILVQHLDPTHESLMVNLLTGHTAMTVRQAADGIAVERDHLYVIPPGTYLAIEGGFLRLSKPLARHGARLPFDFLLHSLAKDRGDRAIGVVLSGTGADGSLGVVAIKEKGGLVVAQDPDEAGYNGMPLSAIATGAVNLVLSAAEIPAALVRFCGRARALEIGPATQDSTADWLAEIVALLRTRTAHDFTLYKHGTLQRRIQRRMAMTATAAGDVGRYLKILRADAGERNLLVKDLLINVTSFFRDPKIFESLAEKIVPDLIRNQPLERPLRIWIAGCSTGEETYSLAMLFQEQILAAERNIKLQIFASDVDPDAVAGARDGLYSETIEADVSAPRLARFFRREDGGYRVLPELRASVIFTVQDLLADPPFSRMDLVSCRNLLIYLNPEAQAKVISLFHFALREGGVLLLGSSETIANADNRFALISKPERVYRRIGHSRQGEFGFLTSAPSGSRIPARPEPGQSVSRQAVFADLCRKHVMEAYALAVVLINHRHECLYSLGPTDRYLCVAPGQPTYDILAMVRQELRTKLRSAIQRAGQENVRVIVFGDLADRDGKAMAFRIAVQPVRNDGESLLLICFLDEPEMKSTGHRIKGGNTTRVAELERELEAAKTELQSAIRSLEISSEEQKAINEEALSVNEEYQSANEELLTSKEELQSLNEELTALNGQLQETLERQRTTSDDLQNVLYSTDVATLFLDTDLNIRFFTPATKMLFNVIPGDIGRPLADLRSLAADSFLATDARAVLQNTTLIEREIEAQSGVWFMRRILPYRTNDDSLGGVVITFTDVTERKRIAAVLEAAKQAAELASRAKSRFLAAASHDLRQPLQTLALLQGLLAKKVESEAARQLVARFGETLTAMSGMLNTLLDINQIEAGVVKAEKTVFPVNDLLDQLREEFHYHAQAQGLVLRVVSCGQSIRSDRRLLEQMLRNLLSNALKYTESGKVLLGCRRHGDMLSIETGDTGVGIPEAEFGAIFDEYYQLDNAARERNRGLGLGLSIVQRLGNLLGHRVRVRSRPGKGSLFSVKVARVRHEMVSLPEHKRPERDEKQIIEVRHIRTVLVVEDDPEVRELLKLLLKEEGYRTMTAHDGAAALEMIAKGAVGPDLLLADYNLPGDMNGLQVGAKLRETLHRALPIIILTGDISTGTLRDIAREGFAQLNKPVKLKELTETIHHLLSGPQAATPIRVPLPATAPGSRIPPVIFVVDDDHRVREAIRAVLEDDGRIVEDFPTCESFLEAYHSGCEGCILVDAYLPGMNGIELLHRLNGAGHRLPAIMITGNSDVHMAVEAMKAGAMDFIEKPIGGAELLAGIARALEQSRDSDKLSAWREAAAGHVADLTLRQRQIMNLVLAGQPNKNIAVDLGISQRTVENHRASIMRKTGAKSLPALARLALAAAWSDTEGPPATGS